MSIDNTTRFSADVKMYLDVQDVIVELREILRDRATVAQHSLPSELVIPPFTWADLVINIDGNARREEVCLIDGITAASTRIRFASRSDRTEPLHAACEELSDDVLLSWLQE